MPRARKKAFTQSANNQDAREPLKVLRVSADSTDDTAVATDTPIESPAINVSEIVHGLAESTRLPDDVQRTSEIVGGHAAAVERKPLPRPADPFGIANDVLAGVRLSESRRYGKMLIAFEEKPSPEVIAKLRDANFRWEPAEKVWALALGERAMSARITAEDTFNEVSKMIREERGIKHSVGVAAS